MRFAVDEKSPRRADPHTLGHHYPYPQPITGCRISNFAQLWISVGRGVKRYEDEPRDVDIGSAREPTGQARNRKFALSVGQPLSE
jgi:hypothetical protein